MGPGDTPSCPTSRWEAEFCAKAQRLQACSSTRCRLNKEEILAPATTEAALRAPQTSRATHRGALGQVVATQSVVQVEADHIAVGKGEVLSHGRAGNSGERASARTECEKRTARTQRDSTGQNTSEGTGRGGAASAREAVQRPLALTEPRAPPLATLHSAPRALGLPCTLPAGFHLSPGRFCKLAPAPRIPEGGM